MIDTNQENFNRTHVNELKDHELREFVNDLTKTARIFAGSQQLRERLSGIVISALRPRRNHCSENNSDQCVELAIDDPVLKGLHYERELLTDKDISDVVLDRSDYTHNEIFDLINLVSEQQDKHLAFDEILKLLRRTRQDAAKKVLEAIKDK